MATLFTVGEMAKLSNISKQTLIFYDRKGVFSPNYVDPDNGYRYYSADQLELLDNILILKEMGLSLEEIKSFMENRSVELALSLMREQKQKMEQRMERIWKLQKKLDDKIEVLEAFQKDEKRIVFLEKTEPEYLLLESVDGCGDLLQQAAPGKAGELPLLLSDRSHVFPGEYGCRKLASGLFYVSAAGKTGEGSAVYGKAAGTLCQRLSYGAVSGIRKHLQEGMGGSRKK